VADHPRTIVVVDDDRSIRLLVSAQLRQHGYQVEVAQDGIEALELIARVQPAIVILDVTMPQLDGFEVLRRLRAFSTVPVILLTGVDDYPHKALGLDLGADDYVTKPFSPSELAARVRAVLRRSGSWQIP